MDTEETLREAILADIDNDAPRLVYADWLIERNDPRGELIALQCHSDAASSRARVRASQLLKAHKDEWLGDLACVAVNVELRRGFLASFTLDHEAKLSSAEWGRLAESQLLRTVEEIRLGRASKERFFELVSSSRATNLRVLHHVGSLETQAIARGPARRIETLVANELLASALLAELFGTSPGLPRLSGLIVTGRDRGRIDLAAERWEAIRTLHAQGALPRLRRLDVTVPHAPDRPGAEAAFARIGVVLSSLPLPSARLALDRWGLRVLLARTADGNSLRIEVVGPIAPQAARLLGAFDPRVFAEVTIARGISAVGQKLDMLDALFPNALHVLLEAPS